MRAGLEEVLAALVGAEARPALEVYAAGAGGGAHRRDVRALSFPHPLSHPERRPLSLNDRGTYSRLGHRPTSPQHPGCSVACCFSLFPYHAFSEVAQDGETP